MGRWQAKLEKRQAVLGRIVDIGAELFAISAAVVYADTQRREATELADLFCRQARRRVEALFDSLFDNDDTDAYELAQGVLGGRFSWLEEGVVDPAG
jgi:hypothetical protein